MRLKDIDKEDRPREKLKNKGVKNLSNYELISLILSKGSQQKDITQLSCDILKTFPLQKLKDITPEELMIKKGIGISKACQLIAAIELGDRVKNYESNPSKEINSPKKAFKELRTEFKEDQESLVALFLDSRNKLLSKKTIFIGTINKQIVSPREIVKHAIAIKAINIIIAHNHPSGNLNPSNADIKTTNKIQRSLDLFELHLNDHLIIANNKYYSMKENSLL